MDYKILKLDKEESKTISIEEARSNPDYSEGHEFRVIKIKL